MEISASWSKCPKARQVGVYWRRKNNRVEYGFLRPRGNVEYAGLTLRDAVDRRSQALLDSSAGKQAPNTKLRVRDLAETVRESKNTRLRPSSFEAFERGLDKHILPAIGHMKPIQVTPEDIGRLVRKMERGGLNGNSILRYLSPLGAIFNLAVRRGCIATSPVTLLTDDERPDGGRRTSSQYEWSREDLEALFAAARELDARKTARQRYFPLVSLLALTGMRVSEALALRWGDIDLLSGVLCVRGSLSRSGGITETKTAAGVRTIPLSDAIVRILVEHKPLDALDGGWVFPATVGKNPLGYHSFRTKGFTPALKIAGLSDKGITIHSLRHALASNLISSGISDVDVAAMLGHASPNTTRAIYAHVFDRVDSHERIRSALGTLGQA